MNKPLFARGVQAGVVVKDAEKVAKYWAEELGIGPWWIYKVKMNPEDEFPIMVIARVWVGELEIELIQSAIPNDFYTEHLNKCGQGIHHLQFRADDYEECYNSLKDKGYEVLFEGELPGEIPFAYFDTREDLGFISEIADFHGIEWEPDYKIEVK